MAFCMTFRGKPGLQSLSNSKSSTGAMFYELCWWNSRIKLPASILQSAGSCLWENACKWKLQVTYCSVPLAMNSIAEGKAVINHVMQNLCSLLSFACWASLLAVDTNAMEVCRVLLQHSGLGRRIFLTKYLCVVKMCLCRLPNVNFYLLWSPYELYITKSYMTWFVIGCLSEPIT